MKIFVGVNHFGAEQVFCGGRPMWSALSGEFLFALIYDYTITMINSPRKDNVWFRIVNQDERPQAFSSKIALTVERSVGDTPN